MGGNSNVLFKAMKSWDFGLPCTWNDDEKYDSYLRVGWAPAELCDIGRDMYWVEPLHIGTQYESGASKITLAERVHHILGESKITLAEKVHHIL
jgi:hypothetical protein